MKYILVIFALIGFVGCSPQKRSFDNDPDSFVEQPDQIADGSVDVATNVTAAIEADHAENLPEVLPAPDLVGLTNWINSDKISSLSELRGQVVLIDFWTYACINCRRTLPHVQALYERYQDEGFVVLGLHAPEFSYERKIENVRTEVLKHGLTYPIAQDNDFATWRNYNNRYWPAHYLIDKEGSIRYTHFGEGAYQEMDQWVAKLLAG